MRRVFVDTNVLFPFAVMDLMLALSEDGIHDVLWSEALLQEWEEVVTRDHRRSPATAAAITQAIREYFADSRVAEEDYTALIPDMPGADADDHQHMAAAIAGGADALVTWNLADFPAAALARYGLQVLDPDDYLSALMDTFPDEVAVTVVRIAGEKRRPPMSTSDLLNALEKAGVAMFADNLRHHLR